MTDYFEELENKLNKIYYNIEIIENDIFKCKMNHTFELFEFGISDEIKYIYNNYQKFFISWKEAGNKIYGYVDFVPYNEIFKEYREVYELIESVEEDLIEDQAKVINDLKNWYPLFKFPNGDAFCYDKRNGKIVFFEHEVFDTGVNLNGLVIADSLDDLLKKWSEVLFVDIYDWYEGVNESGIDLSKSIYNAIFQFMKNNKITK